MSESTLDWTVTAISDLDPVEVSPGIRRWTLPAGPRLSVWLLEFAPGTEWPEDDHHTTVEEVFVYEGEFEDAGRTYTAGCFLHFEPGTTHRPSTRTGGRMFGYNFAASA